MSVVVLRSARSNGRALAQFALALGAVLAVGALVALLVWVFAPASAAPPPRNPFGMGLREAAPGAGAFGRLVLHYQGEFFLALKAALSALKTDTAAIWPLVGIGFAYGIFHAAGPGHGKAVISAYILSSERALAKGVVLSFAAGLIQAIVAIGLVGAVFIAAGGTAATMSRAANLVELAGFACVAALGAIVTWRKAGKLLDLVDFARHPGAARIDDCGCDHLPPPEQLERSSPRDMAGIALGAGIRPCAGAILILVLALSQHRLGAGIAATLAMALGTAITTSAIAAISVYAKRLALQLAGGRGMRGTLVVSALELATAAFVIVVGLSLLTGVWSGEGGI